MVRDVRRVHRPDRRVRHHALPASRLVAIASPCPTRPFPGSAPYWSRTRSSASHCYAPVITDWLLPNGGSGNRYRGYGGRAGCQEPTSQRFALATCGRSTASPAHKLNRRPRPRIWAQDRSEARQARRPSSAPCAQEGCCARRSCEETHRDRRPSRKALVSARSMPEARGPGCCFGTVEEHSGCLLLLRANGDCRRPMERDRRKPRSLWAR